MNSVEIFKEENYEICTSVIENIVKKFKIKYTMLDVFYMDETFNNKKYLVFIDLHDILPVLEKGFKRTSVEKNYYNLHSSFGLLNLISHYKHYYRKKLKSDVVIFAYVRDVYDRVKYKDIIENFIEFINYIPGIIFCTPKMDDDGNKLFMTHIINSIIRLYVSKYKDNKIIVHIYSLNKADNSIIADCDCGKIIKNTDYKIYCFDKKDLISRVLKEYKNIYENTEYRREIEYLYNVFRYARNEYGDDMKPPFSIFRSKKFYDEFMLFLKENVGAEKSYLIKRFGIRFYNSYYDNYINDMTKIDYEFNKKYIHVIKPLLNNWFSKIKDKSIYSIDNIEDVFKNHQIRIDWLME